jgi:hypothetical protein
VQLESSFFNDSDLYLGLDSPVGDLDLDLDFEVQDLDLDLDSDSPEL